jgi:hypothetical protein
VPKKTEGRTILYIPVLVSQQEMMVYSKGVSRVTGSYQGWGLAGHATPRAPSMAAHEDPKFKARVGYIASKTLSKKKND